MREWQTETRGPEETRSLAALLGKQLSGNEVLLLCGPLGAGKTCFVQGLARGFGVAGNEPVTSPSFALMNQYPGGRQPLFHFDLYRLGSFAELDELGLEEYLEGQGVAVIEWAERLGELAPGALRIELADKGGDLRRIRFTAEEERLGETLKRLAQLWSEKGEKAS